VVEDVQEMRKMILDEVLRFRQLVRMQPTHAQHMQNPMAAQVQSSVPIPEPNQQWRQEDPRPQEVYATNAVGLEQDLKGLDAVRH
jgi:mitogen-activated protein kinase 7